MKRIGVREFRDHATQYLAGDEVLAIERHGQPLGFYIPAAGRAAARKAKVDAAFARLEATVQRVMAQTGLSEEELSRLFDVTRPLPDLPAGEKCERAPGDHATGR
jgi:hypothetical protein